MKFKKIMTLIFLYSFFINNMVATGSNAKTYKDKLNNINTEYAKIQTQIDEKSSALEKSNEKIPENSNISGTENASNEAYIEHLQGEITELTNKQNALIKEKSKITEPIFNDFEILENKSKDLENKYNNLQEDHKKELYEKEEKFEKERKKILDAWKKQVINVNELNQQSIDSRNQRIKELESSKGALEVLYNNSIEFLTPYKIQIIVGTVVTTLAAFGSYLWYKNKKREKEAREQQAHNIDFVLNEIF